MSNDMRKMVEKKAKIQFKDADISIKLEEGKLVISVEGVLNDVTDLMNNIASFVETTGKFTGLPNFDIVLSVQGTFYSFELEMYR